MINYAKGDILRDESEALVNTVNCVGIMGRGIALQFRNAFPDNFKAYAKACQREEYSLASYSSTRPGNSIRATLSTFRRSVIGVERVDWKILS